MEYSYGACNSPTFPDLNYENEIKEEECCDEQPFEEEECCDEQPFEEEEYCEEQPLEDTLVSNDDEVQTGNQVESLEEVEKRLEIGQVVKDEEMAYGLYCKYANFKGFSVRRGKGIHFKDGCGLLQGKFFFCSCEGFKNEVCSKNKVPQFQKVTFRCGCKARLKVTRRKGGVWKVATFHKEHNHELYKVDEAYLLRSGRDLTDQQELMLATMVKSGIPALKAIGYLENSAEGREKVGFLRKDALNRLYKRKTKVGNSDALELLKHFMEKSNNESDFYWKMEVDDDQRLMNFFCRDTRSRIDFECFGDLLSFDTTYKTNKYHMVCAPFVGINHHNQNVMFGFALMSDETESSFEWLFREFLTSMGGKQPGVVFTDQCQAMMNAIKTVFPDSHHRLCQWHIKRNAPSHMGTLGSDNKFQQLWKKCMTYCESVEEFEATWNEMMVNYKLGDPDWFKMMYKERHKWATAFSCHIFSAGLLATSRSERTNSALKSNINVSSTSSLLDCINGYEQVLNDWRITEKESDVKCLYNQPTLFVPSNPLLQQAAKVYTIDVYNLFEKELKDTMGFEPPHNFSSIDSSLMSFQVKSYGQSSKIRIVQYDPQEFEVKCTCHNFETVGILCSHALKVLDALNVRIIPEKYIRKRWTKTAKSGGYVDQCSGMGNYGIHRDKSYVFEMAYVTHATKEVHDIAIQAKAHEETRDILSRHIACAKKEIDAWINDPCRCHDLPGEEENSSLVRDPLIAKTRGITNVHKRFWDKKKKRKGKAESLQKTRTAKHKGEGSQTVRDSQGSRNVQPTGGSTSHVARGIREDLNLGMDGYFTNVYPFCEFNMNMSQENRGRTTPH